MKHDITTGRKLNLLYLLRHFPIPETSSLVKNNKIKGSYGRNILRDIKDAAGFLFFSWIMYMFFASANEGKLVSPIVVVSLGIFVLFALLFLYLMVQRIILYTRHGNTFLHLKNYPIYLRDTIEGSIEFSKKNFKDLTVCLRFVAGNGMITYEDKIVLEDVHNRQSFTFQLPKEQYDEKIYQGVGNWQIEAYGDRFFANFQTTYFLSIEFKTEQQEKEERAFEETEQLQKMSYSYNFNGNNHDVDQQELCLDTWFFRKVKNQVIFVPQNGVFISIFFLLIFALPLSVKTTVILFKGVSLTIKNFLIISGRFLCSFSLLSIAAIVYFNNKRKSVFGRNGETSPWTKEKVSSSDISFAFYSTGEIFAICLCAFTLVHMIKYNFYYFSLTLIILLMFFFGRLLYKYMRFFPRNTYVHFDTYPFTCGEEMHIRWEYEHLPSVTQATFYLQCMEEHLIEKRSDGGGPYVSIKQVHSDKCVVHNIPKHLKELPISFKLPKKSGTSIGIITSRYWQLKAEIKNVVAFETFHLLPVFDSIEKKDNDLNSNNGNKDHENA
ncbi:hypothetical protein [Candidatus Uabimicrobium sp. HlEnr_7]|uniref:hypothetical protein n=1 Tax=Candidatus Uabimicrobium helgolandensis TaxID=3095367 RepID=UPI003558B0E7